MKVANVSRTHTFHFVSLNTSNTWIHVPQATPILWLCEPQSRFTFMRAKQRSDFGTIAMQLSAHVYYVEVSSVKNIHFVNVNSIIYYVHALIIIIIIII